MKLLDAPLGIDAPPEILLRRKFGSKKRGDQIIGEPRSNDLRANAHDIHIVMLDALVGRMDIVTDRGADTLHLVGRNRGTNTGAAHHDAAGDLSGDDLPRDRPCDIRKIHRIFVVGSDIDDLMADGWADPLDTSLPEPEVDWRSAENADWDV